MSKPKVVIIAGGSNSRFFPLNTEVHKGAITLLGESFISRTLKSLANHDFNEIIIVQSPRDAESGSLKKAIEQSQHDVQVQYVVQQEAKGMGDALLTAKTMVNESFAVVFPYQFNAGEELQKLIEQSGADGAMAVTHTNTPWLYGIVSLDGKRITSVTEKPVRGTEKSQLKERGLHYLTHDFFQLLEQEDDAEYNYENALNKFVQTHEVNAVEQSNPLPSLKYPWHLFKFQEVLFSQKESHTDPSAQIAKTAILDDSHGPIIIEAGAKVGDFAKLVGPVYLGKNTLVGDYSFIRGTSLEEKAVVGANTEIARSIILGNSTTHFSYMADSILGPNNQIGAGLITANKRIDRVTVKTMVKGVKTDTNLKALGIITGEGAKLGIGINTMPGVLIGSGAVIHPGSTVSKNVEHNETIQRT